MENDMRQFVFQRDGYRCQYCRRSPGDGVELHVDHIIPVSKGGTSAVTNLQTLCANCNLSKGAKTFGTDSQHPKEKVMVYAEPQIRKKIREIEHRRKLAGEPVDSLTAITNAAWRDYILRYDGTDPDGGGDDGGGIDPDIEVIIGMLESLPPKATRKKKVDTARITLHLQRENLERARGALSLAILRGRVDIRSMSQLFDRALSRELDILRDELKPEGGEFQAMNKTPTTGRPPGT